MVQINGVRYCIKFANLWWMIFTYSVVAVNCVCWFRFFPFKILCWLSGFGSSHLAEVCRPSSVKYGTPLVKRSSNAFWTCLAHTMLTPFIIMSVMQEHTMEQILKIRFIFLNKRSSVFYWTIVKQNVCKKVLSVAICPPGRQSTTPT